MKKIVYLTTMALFLVGCGDNLRVSGSQTNLPNVSTSDIREAISKGRVDGYSKDAQLKDNILAVINYIRSQNITCNDSEEASAPTSQLVWSTELENAALEHSKDMLSANHFSHYGSGTSSDITGVSFNPPRESDYKDRIVYNGYNGSNLKENIATVSSQGREVPKDYWIDAINQWIESTDGHCSILLSSEIDKIGMAEAKNSSNTKVYYTADFGKD